MAHAHARGILHRDLKPANILVDGEGHPHVTDFGLAKKVESDVELTQSGAILGTPAYMSPEQASGRRGSITTATDVYGLGAVLYALLTGRAPFGGDSVVETIEAVRNTPPEPPTKLNPRVPRDLETICLKCLEKDPRRRFPTAQALADDLEAWLESRPIAARRVGATERAWLWCKRRPAVAGLSAAVVLVALAGLAFGASQWGAAVANAVIARQNAAIAQGNADVANQAEQGADPHEPAAGRLARKSPRQPLRGRDQAGRDRLARPDDPPHERDPQPPGPRAGPARPTRLRVALPAPALPRRDPRHRGGPRFSDGDRLQSGRPDHRCRRREWTAGSPRRRDTAP